MKNPGAGDDLQDLINRITNCLTEYSQQYPELCLCVFRFEDGRWIAKSEYPVLFTNEDDYYRKNLKKLLDYIDLNYNKEISEESAAGIIGLSISEFCRFFRKQTGNTFTTYKNKVKTEKAALFLTEPDKTCEQVGMDCGFSSYQYFNRVFKAYYRVSPKEYRNCAK